ncbi:hypothetical protein PR048_033450 [Dryococelus australis]|uniref:Uncharacterized protein n=1 Tax=Dryococelus australis TaxID=614101 RepID=A0ABQ9G0B7_9NEOP|nr:hypothetical protein PR048_033450 [Dryococelus australis]
MASPASNMTSMANQRLGIPASREFCHSTRWLVPTASLIKPASGYAYGKENDHFCPLLYTFLLRIVVRLPNSRAGSLQGVRLWESYRMMSLVDGFSRWSPVFAPPFHSGAAPYSPSITLIGTKKLAADADNARWDGICFIAIGYRSSQCIASHRCGSSFILRELPAHPLDGEVWQRLRLATSRAKRGEYGVALECNGGGNRRPPRKLADQRHRPPQFPSSKVPGATPPGIESSSQWWEAGSLTTTPPPHLFNVNKTKGGETFVSHAASCDERRPAMRILRLCPNSPEVHTCAYPSPEVTS